MNKIIVLFKTHLDLGFTDLAECVKDNYMKNYLPNAMRIAKEMRGQEERFIWTTGSWLIERYLEEGGDSDQLEEAIRLGEVRWHGLPFTTHTELMDQGLFRFGLDISGKLDRRFHMNTRAAKMTDVPGHTIAMLPLLAKAGIRFLHIGVNPASTRPEVPSLFRWRAEGGEEIVVMYHNDYGELMEIGISGTAVCFAHTGDNSGPQSVEQIQEIYRKLHRDYPEAKLCAGTLEDVAKVALREKGLSVITSEIGDTWIHGAGTDPHKVNLFRALLRMKDHLPEESMRNIYREILPVPEHTWGLDEKTWLGKTRELGELAGEHKNFIKTEFMQARTTEKYRHMEESWKEQRAYVERALKVLENMDPEYAASVSEGYKREATSTIGYLKAQPGQIFELSGYQISVNQQGAVCWLMKNERVLADKDHLLGGFLYEVFSEKEYARFKSQYVTSDETWAIEDFGKIGISEAVGRYQEYRPEVSQICYFGSRIVISMKLPAEAVEKFGGMEQLELLLNLTKEAVYFDFAWFGKQATRIAEASWLQFHPMGKINEVQKMGSWINPYSVVSKGNRSLHAVFSGVRTQDQIFETLDAPLVNLGKPSLLNFTNELPSETEGFSVNLHNNVWGTNFPMWYEEDARFRFVVRVL